MYVQYNFMNNLNTRIILINQYFRLVFKFDTPPISNLYIRQFSRQILVDIVIVSHTHDALVSFFVYWFRRSWQETAIISIRRAALAIRAETIIFVRAETDAPLADGQGKSQNSSGSKGGTNSYCQSRNGLMVMGMRVRLAICLANTCRHSNCFRYTWRPGIVFFTDLGDHGGETAIISIRRAALAVRAEQFWTWQFHTNRM